MGGGGHVVAQRYKHWGPGCACEGTAAWCWARARPSRSLKYQPIGGHLGDTQHPRSRPRAGLEATGGRWALCSASQGRSWLHHSPRGQLPGGTHVHPDTVPSRPPPPLHRAQPLVSAPCKALQASRSLRPQRPATLHEVCTPDGGGLRRNRFRTPQSPPGGGLPTLLVPSKHGASGSSGHSGCGRF